MSSDNRKKGCTNTSCEMNQNKHLFPATDKYCSQCGQPLVFVCKKCFKKIDDLGPHHTICASCALGKDDKKDFIKGKGKAVLGVAAGAVGFVANVAGKEVKAEVARGVKKAVAVAVPAAIAAIKNIR